MRKDKTVPVITKAEARENVKDNIFYTIIDALNKVEVDTSVSVDSVVVDCGEIGICKIDAIDGVWRSRWEKQTEAEPLVQYVEKQIRRILEEAVTIYDAGCVPSAIFMAQQHLIDAWRKYQEGGK